MKVILVLVASLAIGWSNVAAQKIHGKVVDNDGKGLEFANVVLYNVSDTSMIKIEVSNERGEFAILNNLNNDVYVEVSFVGFETQRSNALLGKTDHNLKEISLSPVNTLQNVTVRAARPIVQLKADRTSFNIEGSINSSGSDAFALLRKAPGVVIDNNDNIIMMGKTGVRVFIDGKPSPLQGDALVQYLQSIPSEQIDAIDIITNPGAKYEAEGNAGIIDIRFKKNQNEGSNYSLIAGTSYGKAWKHNISGSTGVRKGNIGFNGSLNWSDKETKNEINLYRQQFGGTFDQKGQWTNLSNGIGYRFSLDWYANDHHTIGAIVDGRDYNSGEIVISNSLITKSSVNDQLLEAKNQGDKDLVSKTYNINHQWKINENNSLHTDIDYGTFITKESQLQPNSYFNIVGGDKVLDDVKNYHILSPQDIKIKSVKTDFESQINNLKLQVGAKYAEVTTNNNFNFNDIVDGRDVVNYSLTSDYDYIEKVAAVYTNLNYKFSEKVNANFGLRMENTKSIGTLVALDTVQNQQNKRSYTDVFPSMGISWAASTVHSFNFSITRRLSRPNYESLNPFQSRLDELTFMEGNPHLKPEYSYIYTLGHAWGWKLNTTLSYTHTSDQITEFVYVPSKDEIARDPSKKDVSFLTNINLNNQKVWALSMGMPLQITNYWSSFTNLSASVTHNKTTYEDVSVDVKAKSMNIFSQHTFQLPKDWSLELSGFYMSPSLWGGVFQTKAFGQVDIGAQKSLLNNTLKIKLTGQDIFNTAKWSGKTEIGELKSRGNGTMDARRIGLQISYNFGNNKIKKRDHKGGMETEASRTGNAK